jgi:hypothetical protein
MGRASPRLGERVDALVRALAGLPGATAERVPDADFGAPGLRLRLDPAGRRSVADLVAALEGGSPSIVVGAGEESLRFNLTTVVAEDDAVIAERLRTLLAS